MKILVLTLISILFQVSIEAQTAEEIIAKTEYTYRHIANYVDKGVYTTISEGQTKYTHTFNYFLALDSSKNVNHWIFQLDASSTKGYSYTKSSQKQEGVYTRVLDVPQALPENLSNAAARLGAVGGGILDMAASLMYPDLFPEMEGNPDVLYRFDEIKRLQDSTISDHLCFVIELIKHVELTQEMIDQDNRARDSIINLQLSKYPQADRPPIPAHSKEERKPGTQTFMTRYYIQKNDNLIIQREKYNLNPSTKYTTILKLNPKVNVVNFQQYLEKE